MIPNFLWIGGIIALALNYIFNLAPSLSLHSYNRDLHLNRHIIPRASQQRCFSTKEEFSFTQRHFVKKVQKLFWHCCSDASDRRFCLQIAPLHRLNALLSLFNRIYADWFAKEIVYFNTVWCKWSSTTKKRQDPVESFTMIAVRYLEMKQYSGF